MSVGTDIFGVLRGRLEAIARDSESDATSRVAKLRAMRDELLSAAGVADSYLGDVNLEREAQAQEIKQALIEARERADIRERALFEELATPEQLDAEGFLSHQELDYLEEEGLLIEEVLGFERLHPRKRKGAPRGGQWIKKLTSLSADARAIDTVSVPGQTPVTNSTLRVIREKRLDREVPPLAARGEKAQRVLGDATDSREKHQVRPGVYSAERHKVHLAIVEDMLKGHESQESPQALIMAGGPASGKSVALRADPSMRPDDAVDINPDEVMERLPEYEELHGDTYMAYGLHEEASDVAKLALEEAKKRKLNLVIDGVGDSSPGKFVGRIRRVKEAGYSTRVVMVDTDTNTAIDRSIQRAVEPDSPDLNRFIPVAVLKHLHRNAVARMEEWIADESVDRFDIYRTEGGWGEKPKGTLVARGGKGKVEIVDKGLMEKIRGKPNEEAGGRGSD